MPTDAEVDIQEKLIALFAAARADAAHRIRELTLPFVVSELSVVVVRDENNPDTWHSNTITVRRNILASQTVPMFRFAPLLSDEVISSARECASSLAELDSSNLPFFSPFLGSGWILTTSVEDFGTRTSVSYETDSADWTSEHLLLPALLEHLKRLPNIRTASKKAAESFAADVLRVATGADLEYLLSIPLSGITAKSTAVSRTGGEVLRHLPTTEQGSFLPSPSDAAASITFTAPPLVSLDIIVRTDRNAQNPDVRETVTKWLCALSLNGYTPAGTSARLQSHPSWLLPATTNMPLALPSMPSTWSGMTPTKFQKVLDTVQQLTRYSISDPKSKRDLALHRYYWGGTRTNHADGVLDFVIALEALLLPYDEDARRGDLTYRFRIHGGYFLSRTKRERAQVARQVTELYALRSRLVHGDDYPTPTDIDNGWVAARELARRGLCRAISEGFPSAVTFKTMLLGT